MNRFAGEVTPVSTITADDPSSRTPRQATQLELAPQSQFEMEAQRVVELGELSWRDSANPATQSLGRNGSDLLGLRLGVDCETGCGRRQ